MTTYNTFVSLSFTELTKSIAIRQCRGGSSETNGLPVVCELGSLVAQAPIKVQVRILTTAENQLMVYSTNSVSGIELHAQLYKAI